MPLLMEGQNIVSSHQSETLLHESFSIDQETLTKLVESNIFTILNESGGIHGIAASLETNLDTGISGHEMDLRRRRQVFGSNLTLEDTCPLLLNKNLINFRGLINDAIKDSTVILLLCCATLSLVLGIKKNGFEQGIFDGVMVFVVISSAVCISSIIKFVKNRINEKINSRRRRAAVKVMRDGRVQQVAVSEVVVGDIVCLESGDQVPADGLFINGNLLKLDDDDDSLMQECFHYYHDKFPSMFSGAKVVGGDCCMLVTSVGKNTETSKLMKKLFKDRKESKLLIAVEKMNSRLEKIWLSLSMLVLVEQVFRCFAWETVCNDDHDPDPKGVKNAVQETMVEATKIIRRHGATHNNPLYGINSNNLLLDQAMMADLWIGTDRFFESMEGINVDVLNALREAIGTTTTTSSEPTAVVAMVLWAKKVLGVDREKMKQNCTVEACDISKNRARLLLKWNGDGNNSVNMHWSGSPERILSMCTLYFDRHGTLQTLDENKRDVFKKTIEDISADDSLRCIAFACKQVEQDREEEIIELADCRLTWLGLMRLKNPYAPEVKQAVEDCGESGVKIKLMLEDADINTARLVAVNSGILKPDEDTNEAVIEASVFRNSSDEARSRIIDSIRVIANASPSDKLLMVQCLKQKGEVVAVTGICTRDAISLKEADVGVSPSERSAQVARDNSDIIIMDQKFATIVASLKWGRCVCNNIRKFIQLHLTVNVSAFTINLVAAIFFGEVPLQPFQLLWVNLIMDVLGALALAAPILSQQLPAHAAASPLTTNTMWINIIAQVLYQVFVLLITQFKGKELLHVNQTVLKVIVFNSLVLCQVFVLINAREIEKPNIFEGKRLHQNIPFLVILEFIFIFEVAIIEIVAIVARGTRLDVKHWCVWIGIAFMSLPMGLVAKCISVPW